MELFRSGRVGSGRLGLDDGNSDNRANSVQLELELGLSLAMRAKSRKVPNSDPVLRVRNWLDKTTSPPPIFKVKKIDTETLRRALKRMQGKKVHGVDNIDSYSIKSLASSWKKLYCNL